MKTLTTILFIFIFPICYGQTANKLKGIPKTIEESFIYLEQMFDDTTGYNFITLPENISTVKLHYGLGMWIRNNWGLWGNSQLQQCLHDSGFIHPDDMSAIILKAYHRHLNGKKLNLKEEAKKYKSYWNSVGGDGFSAGDRLLDLDSNTTAEDLLKYYPVGDTIIISVRAIKKRFFKTKSENINGIAIIKEHISTKIKVEIIKLDQKKDYILDNKQGDIIEEFPFWCSLIPPKGWSWTKLNNKMH